MIKYIITIEYVYVLSIVWRVSSGSEVLHFGAHEILTGSQTPDAEHLHSLLLWSRAVAL